MGHASVLLAFCATDSSEGKWCSRECLGAERDLSIDALFWVAGVGRSGDGIAMIQIAPDGGRKVCSGDSTVDRDRDVSSLGDDVTTPTDLQSGAAEAIFRWSQVETIRKM